MYPATGVILMLITILPGIAEVQVHGGTTTHGHSTLLLGVGIPTGTGVGDHHGPGGHHGVGDGDTRTGDTTTITIPYGATTVPAVQAMCVRDIIRDTQLQTAITVPAIVPVHQAITVRQATAPIVRGTTKAIAPATTADTAITAEAQTVAANHIMAIRPIVQAIRATAAAETATIAAPALAIAEVPGVEVLVEEVAVEVATDLRSIQINKT